jgi:glycosyltransferase involved in cell wall biosynthesis
VYDRDQKDPELSMTMEASLQSRRVGPASVTCGARVLYVTDGFSPFVVGGMQAVARRQIETLVDAGFEVISVSSQDEGRPHDKGLGWRNISIPWPSRSTWRKLSPYRYVRDLELFSEEVLSVIDSVEPDCVYSEGPLISAYLNRPRSRRAPTIFHPHGLNMFQHKGSIIEDAKSLPLRSITSFHAQNADVVVCLSRRGPLMRILTECCGVPPERIFVMPNAVSLDQTLAEAPKPRAVGGRFLFIGRNEPIKGAPLLLKAFKGLTGATLDIVGGHMLPPGASATIRAHGEVRDRTRIREFFAAADFVVTPSYSEGMPTVILEAFAQATPVIATDVGASADAVRTRETGFLIPRGDAGALREAMAVATALDDVAYAQLSANCLEEARTTYAPATVGDQLAGLIVRLAANQDARRHPRV